MKVRSSSNTTCSGPELVANTAFLATQKACTRVVLDARGPTELLDIIHATKKARL